MADHVIKQLRDAVIARVTGLTTTGARVHPYRVNPLDSIADLPALIVRTQSEEIEVATIHAPAIYDRVIDVTIFAYVSGSSSIDDALDQVRKEVEIAMGTAITVGGRALLPLLTASEIDETDGERPAGELQMRFQMSVSNRADVPDVIL